ncbi:hypothetical protein AB9K34_10920 [Sedimentitalea sp. XS_ASV28]|uniref:hypothetical protein n=1 Tax=Sedimentitalea sp. XS_ASV28 TaxID=3241296 RepID=UPI0035141073
MVIFGLFRKSKSKNEIRCKKGRGNTFEIAGAGNYQAELLRLAGGRKREYGVRIDEQATLSPEPSNPHDPDAVAVFIRKMKVGYLRKNDAPTFGAFLKEAGADRASCSARIVGGWDDGEGNEGHFGVKLSLSWPPKIAI